MIIKLNNLGISELTGIHLSCDKDFQPSLSARVDISEYCQKLFLYSEILAAYDDDKLMGVCAIYCNDKIDYYAFISSICIFKDFRGMGIGKALLHESLTHAKLMGMRKARIQVGKTNKVAQRLYLNEGFMEVEAGYELLILEKTL